MVKVLSHLLLHYPIASDLWAFLFCLNEISWLSPNSVDLMLESCDSFGHVWCYAFGVKGIATFWRIKSLLCQISSFYFLKTPWMGIEVLHSLHVFFDGISRHYTFLPLLLLYYSWFHHFHVFLFYSCFDLLF